jgi:catalase
MVTNLARVDLSLAGQVAANLGLAAPTGATVDGIGRSPALSMAPEASGPVDGRVIGVLVAEGVDAAGVTALRKALEAAGAATHVIAPHGGKVRGSARASLVADATLFNSDSVVYDALVVAGGTDSLEPKSAMMVEEAYRHQKTIAAWGTGVDALTAASIDTEEPGVVTADRVTKKFTDTVIETLGWHRHWER